MKKIKQHEFNSDGASRIFNTDRLNKVFDWLDNQENVVLINLKETPKTISIIDIIKRKNDCFEKNILLWIDMGLEHFNRVLANDKITILLGEKEYQVEPESSKEKQKIDYLHWYQLFFPAYLFQYDQRLKELLNIDLEQLVAIPNDFNKMLVEYIKAWQVGDSNVMNEKLEAIRVMSKSDEAVFISLKGVSKTSKKGIAETRTTLRLPIIELIDAAYKRNEVDFNTILEKYLNEKREYIIKRKLEANKDHWIDFPALACCAYALEQGMKIEVESDYIPEWVYKREFS